MEERTEQDMYYLTHSSHYIALDIALYFIILLCLIPDDFTGQGESTGVVWVNQIICLCV